MPAPNYNRPAEVPPTTAPPTESSDQPGPPSFTPPPPLAGNRLQFEPEAVKPLQPLAPRALAAQMMLGVAAVLQGWILFIALDQRDLFGRIRDGDTWSLDELTNLEDRIDLANVVWIITLLTCAAAFITWMYRAYQNLSTFRRNEHSDGWAIGAWFVPFLNLWRPFKIVEELVDYSSEQPKGGSKVPFAIWWASWAIGMVVSRVVNAGDAETIESAVNLANGEIATHICLIIAAVAGIFVVRQVTADQEQRARPTTVVT